MIGILIVIGLIWYTSRKEYTPFLSRIILQTSGTFILGIVLPMLGKIEDAGDLEGVRVIGGILGLVIFWGSWINLFRFLYKLPNKQSTKHVIKPNTVASPLKTSNDESIVNISIKPAQPETHTPQQNLQDLLEDGVLSPEEYKDKLEKINENEQKKHEQLKKERNEKIQKNIQSIVSPPLSPLLT